MKLKMIMNWRYILIVLLVTFCFYNLKAYPSRISTNYLNENNYFSNVYFQVEQLAEWIMAKKQDYKLIDVREDTRYNQYSIPTAMNVDLTDIFDVDIAQNDFIIIYADFDDQMLAAYHVLASMNFTNVHILKGGFNAWVDKIMHPVLPDNPTQEQEEKFEQLKKYSEYFNDDSNIGYLQR